MYKDENSCSWGVGGMCACCRGDELFAPGRDVCRDDQHRLVRHPPGSQCYLQMALHPHIVHIVGHTEAHHAATANDIIEACRLAPRAIENALAGQPDMTADPAVQNRRAALVQQAGMMLEAIRSLAGSGVRDALIDPTTLAGAVRLGVLDAPQLRNNPCGRGQIQTRILNGACVAVDPGGECRLEEEKRLSMILREG